MPGKKDKNKNLKPWKPGESGNPGGRPKLPDEIKELRKLTAHDVELLIYKFLKLNRDELNAVIQNPTASSQELWVASLIHKGVIKGDHVRLDFLYNRTIGKVTDKVEHTLPTPTVINKSDGTQVILGATLKRKDDDEDTE